MAAWQVIGFFGSAGPTGIPRVLPAAVLDPEGASVVVIDVAESEADLRGCESLTLEDFRSCLASGEATALPTALWEPEVVLFAQEGVFELLPVVEAESRMKAFVDACRSEGQDALQRGDQGRALEAFDRARRVSNEREDIEQVVALALNEDVRTFFARQLMRRA